MRPILRGASSGLADVAKLLLAQTTEQEKTSAADGDGSGGTGVSGRGGGDNGEKEKSWEDAFTDPNYYQPVTASADGSELTVLGEWAKWIADFKTWVMGLGDTVTESPRLDKILKAAGKFLGVVGGIMGILDIVEGFQNEDIFLVADGYVSVNLSALAVILAVSGVGGPVVPIVGAVGLVWGGASLLSGDVPVTKRIWDLYAGMFERTAEAVIENAHVVCPELRGLYRPAA